MTWSIAEKLEEQRKSQEAGCASDQYGFVSKRVFPSIKGPIHIVTNSFSRHIACSHTLRQCYSFLWLPLS